MNSNNLLMEKYSTIRRRFGALLIDSLVLLPVNVAIPFLTAAFTHSAAALSVSSAIVGMISVLYNIFLHYRYGQTIGKMMMKVKVLSDSEGSINLGQSIVRTLPQLLPVMFAVSTSTADPAEDPSRTFVGMVFTAAVSIFLLADIVVCLANEERRALHDFIAGTIVVRTDV